MEVVVYMVIVKSYFKDLQSRLHGRVCLRSSSLQQKCKDFPCKAFATKNSILDITGVPDPPPIVAFGKVIFDLVEGTVISFN